MGKNKSFQGKEAFQRMNFLFQASEFLVSRLNQPSLAAYYGSQMTSICKKSVLRMEPRVKRELCKGCRALLVPGISSKIQVNSRTKNLIVKCLQCGTIKRFPMKPGYKLWVETPEACVQTFGQDNAENSDSRSQQGINGGPGKKQNENKSKNQQKREKGLKAEHTKNVVTTEKEIRKEMQQSESSIEVNMKTDKEECDLTCNIKETKVHAPEQVTSQSQPMEMEEPVTRPTKDCDVR